MIKNQTFFLDSFKDFELQIPRSAPLEYRVSFDTQKDLKAIVFLIGGFGANANMSFFDFEREVVAKEFPVLCVQVLYHCFCARVSITKDYNPEPIMQEGDLKILQKVASICGVSKVQDVADFSSKLALIDEALGVLKAKGELEEEFRALFHTDFDPLRGEYQNYGLLPALDHIATLKDLLKRPEFSHLNRGGGVKSLPRIFAGGSYGGYVAMLTAKIAPHLVDGVLENSGVVLPFLPHVLGREMNVGEFILAGKHYDLWCYLKKFWTCNEASPYYFSKANYLIRTLLNPAHLQILSKSCKKTIFVHYHSAFDDGAPASEKIELDRILKTLSFDSTLHLIRSEKDLDGKTIKSLEHGLRMSDKALMRRELSQMIKKLDGRKGFNGDFELNYPCADKIFKFYDKNGEFGLEISKNNL